jgi:hypothetical protein
VPFALCYCPLITLSVYAELPCRVIALWLYFGYETAISVPDKIFAEAERLARRLKKSRSQVYTEAVTDTSRVTILNRDRGDESSLRSGRYVPGSSHFSCGKTHT